jgi:SAM-dependent methyltransferase
MSISLKELRDEFYLFRQKLKLISKGQAAFADFLKVKGQSSRPFSVEYGKKTYITHEATVETEFDRQYIYHTAWALRKLKEIKADELHDFSSSLYFIGMASASLKVNFYDFRPPQLQLSSLTCKPCDLTNLKIESNSLPFVSCMHVIEHIGLGRYGDPLDYEGDLKAIEELKRVTAQGGYLLFVTPIGGKPRIQFNAHRIYTRDLILSYFKGFELVEFALIPESYKDGGVVVNPPDEMLNRQTYACGCFLLKKL